MFGVVQPISKLLHVKHFKNSDVYFLINTKLTVVLLILFSVLLSTMDLFRASIDCYTDSHEARKKMMDNYCWSMGTYICKNITRGEFIRYYCCCLLEIVWKKNQILLKKTVIQQV